MPPPRTIFAVGGGTKNPVWLQATSDLGGVPQVVREKTVGASYGDAFLAAVAVGIVEPAEIERWNPESRRVTPEAIPAYARQYPLWKELYLRTREISHALGAGR